MKINELKIIAIIVLIILFGKTVISQTWEHVYGKPVRFELTRGVSNHYDHGFIQATIVDYDALWLNKIDVNGNLLWSKYYKHPSQGLYTGCMTTYTPDGSILITGQSNQSDPSGDPVVLKINACGELEWGTIWQVPQTNYGLHIFSNGSGGAILHTRYANSEVSNSINRFQLAEFDANGNFLWSNQFLPYQADLKIINYDMNCMIRTSDGGYLFGGWGYFKDTADIDLFWLRNMMLKCDHDGNTEWVKGYFKQDVDENLHGQIGTVFAYNGKYYAVGTKYNFYGNEVISCTPVLIKTDKSGVIIDSYAMLEDSLVFSSPRAFDVIDDSTVFMATHTTPHLSQNSHIGMILTDTTGNIKKALDSYNGFLVEDCLASSVDGKYLLTGGNYDDDDFNGYAQKVTSQLEWDTIYTGQFTYDSLCGHSIDSTVVILNCDITTGTIEPQPVYKKVSLTIYPNPATDRIAVILPETNRDILITITDLFGRTVIEKKSYRGNTEAILNIQGLTDGYYNVSITENNSIIQTGKFLKKTLNK